MELSNIREKTSSVSMFSSRQNDLSDLKSGDESEEVCSKSNASSELSQMSNDSSNCSQSKIVNSSTCEDLSRLETNLGYQRPIPARHLTPVGHYRSTMLYTPASNMTHSHCFQELSRDREKELTQEIYSSGPSLKVEYLKNDEFGKVHEMCTCQQMLGHNPKPSGSCWYQTQVMG